MYHGPGTVPHFVPSPLTLTILEIGIAIISVLEGNGGFGDLPKVTQKEVAELVFLPKSV